MPDSFKTRLRQMLSEIFESYIEFIVSSTLIDNEIHADLINGILVISTPVVYGRKIMDFFEDEGLYVTKYGVSGTYKVSVCQ